MAREHGSEGGQEAGRPGLAVTREIGSSHSMHVSAHRLVQGNHMDNLIPVVGGAIVVGRRSRLREELVLRDEGLGNGGFLKSVLWSGRCPKERITSLVGGTARCSALQRPLVRTEVLVALALSNRSGECYRDCTSSAGSTRRHDVF